MITNSSGHGAARTTAVYPHEQLVLPSASKAVAISTPLVYQSDMEDKTLVEPTIQPQGRTGKPQRQKVLPNGDIVVINDEETSTEMTEEENKPVQPASNQDEKEETGE